MPSLSFRVRSVTATGAPDPQWWVVYYTDEHSPDPTQPFIEPQAERMFLGETCMPACHPLFQFETALAPPNWYACPESDHYWGDYFDVTQVRDSSGNWWAVSAFTSSVGAPPCTTATSYIQHVAASKW